MSKLRIAVGYVLESKVLDECEANVGKLPVALLGRRVQRGWR